MIAYTREYIKRLLKIDFIKFCIVGGMGFVINLIILTALHNYLKLPIFFAQLIGAEIALFSNFNLHHRWTYKNHKVKKSLSSLLVQFHATSWPAIIGSSVMVTFCEKVFHFDEILALIASSFVALGWNFVWSKYVVWRNVTDRQVQQAVSRKG